ncbi:MAG: alpha-ketoacid dehydrogenase subunit beta [Actinobacteria bacterium]|nr:alpha-ketoacid dehydrogenase subunit beta [Actinomycetota bacterium]
MQEIEYREAIRSALEEEMRRDNSIYVMGEDIGAHGGAFGVTTGLIKKFGKKRVIQTPISEEGYVGIAVGSALNGNRPVVEVMFIDFITLAMDQIINQAAKMRFMFGGKVKVPIVIRTQCGAGRGNAAQHSQSLESWFYHVPGLKVVMPSTPYDVKGLLKSSIRDDNPVIFIEHKCLYNQKGMVPDNDYTIPIGKADIKRDGGDLTLIATSNMVLKAINVSQKISEEKGIEIEVLDPRTLVPLDIETIISSVKKTGKVVILHEAIERGGIAGDISAIIMEKAFDWLDAPVKRICSYNTIVPYNYLLENYMVPSEERIYSEIKSFLAI